MNWKLIFLLSLFGVGMAVSTVFWISPQAEPFFWLAIFILCAVLIARKAPGRFFLHGLMVSLVNSVWITTTHLALFDHYVAHHASEAQMMSGAMMAPRVLMALTGPVVGAVSGLILGLFAFVASRIVKPG